MVLPVHTEIKERASGASALALVYNGRSIAVLRSPEFYPHRKEERCCRQFGIYNTDHPYIKVNICCKQRLTRNCTVLHVVYPKTIFVPLRFVFLISRVTLLNNIRTTLCFSGFCVQRNRDFVCVCGLSFLSWARISLHANHTHNMVVLNSLSIFR